MASDSVPPWGLRPATQLPSYVWYALLQITGFSLLGSKVPTIAQVPERDRLLHVIYISECADKLQTPRRCHLPGESWVGIRTLAGSQASASGYMSSWEKHPRPLLRWQLERQCQDGFLLEGNVWLLETRALN